MKNVKVLIGNYGSGKSELALNFAIRAAARGDRHRDSVPAGGGVVRLRAGLGQRHL